MTTYNTSSRKSWTRFIPVAARILMGLLFTITGLNGFLHFIPQPADAMSAGATALMGGMMGSGYMFPLIFGTQFLAGLLLLSGFFVPLALALIAPVVVNIFAFHLFLAPSGLGMAVFVAVLEIFLAWAYRKSFAAMLQAR
jgi:uncharacterized membrane protein YphA (DoxX/SURF4 family)